MKADRTEDKRVILSAFGGKCKDLCASFTVEAALLFPIIFFLICGLIDFSFFLHEKMCVETIAYKTASSAVLQQRNEIEFQEKTVNFYRQKDSNVLERYIGRSDKTQTTAEEYLDQELSAIKLADIEDTAITVSPLSVTVEVSLSYHSRFFMILDGFSDRIFDTTVVVKQDVYRPEEITRIASVLFETAKGIPKAEELLEKIKNGVSIFKSE